MNVGIPSLPDKFVQTSLQQTKFVSHSIKCNQFRNNNCYCFDSGNMPFGFPKINYQRDTFKKRIKTFINIFNNLI